jgi:ADP-ribosylglycohydrolase
MPMPAWRARGALLGLAVADALGAPLEFSSPQTAAASVRAGLEMSGGRIWAPGEWTDDTAMALCLAESIGERGLLDVDDLAGRYIAWATSGPKDIGITTAEALAGAADAAEARARAEAFHEHTGRTAGNGTVMRAAPIALAAATVEQATAAAVQDARLTHFDPAAGRASAALCAALMAVAQGARPLAAAAAQVGNHRRLGEAVLAAEAGDQATIAALAGGAEQGVCWTALAVGLHALAHIDDYERGVTWAISLGGDTDTNAAVAGALLGCRHGVEAIPARWLEALRDRERIERAADALGPRSAPLGERLSRAVAYACERHGLQVRKGTSVPYVAHLMGVCALVLEDGGDADEAVAALLHDVVEDTDATVEEVAREFGPVVAEIVAGCSDTDAFPKPPWRPRKEAYIAALADHSASVRRVSLADKLHNARAILLDYRELGDDLWRRFHPEADQLWYYRSLVEAFRATTDSPLVDELDRVVGELEVLTGCQ